MKKEIEVVAAIILKKETILCTQRNKGKYDYISYKYEFPGGKVKKRETLKEALAREIKEELGQKIEIKDKYLTVHHEYTDFKIIMHSFICTMEIDTIILKEHIDSKWLKIEELEKLDWAKADLPIVKKLIKDGIYIVESIF